MGDIILRVKTLVLTHKLPTILAASSLAILIVGISLYFVFHKTPQTLKKPNAAILNKPSPTSIPAPKYYSPLTGVQVPDDASTKAQVRGVMIENTPDARPQSGIKDAGVVFEADADGGITRFLALYQESQPTLVGPVRSVRANFIDWLTPFDASISHVGGSAKALGEVRNGSYKDLDEFFNGSSYWRASDRYAPHNVYTNSANLIKLNNAKGYTTSTFTGFPRRDESPAATPIAGSIDINVTGPLYFIHYDYDKATNGYYRFVSGTKFVDREAGWVEPKVVVIMKIPTQEVLEDGYRVEQQTIGNGAAYFFQDGNVASGTWSKASQSAQLVFNDQSGNPMAFNRGQTWVTAVATDHSVTWK